MTINVDELKKLTGRPVSIVYSSTPKLKGGKKNPQQGRIRKTTNAVVTLGSAGNYGLRKVSEGEYETVAEVKSRAWGERVGETCIIEHKGALYLEFYPDGDSHTSYFLDDSPIAKSDIDGLPSSRRQDVLKGDGSHGETEVKPTTVKLDNVSSVVADGIVLGA